MKKPRQGEAMRKIKEITVRKTIRGSPNGTNGKGGDDTKRK